MINDHETGYRKGQLLGFTLAEIILLVLMALLLGMGAVIADLTEERDKALAANEHIEPITKAKKVIIDVLGIKPAPVDETWREITTQVETMKSDLDGLTEKLTRLETAEKQNSQLATRLAQVERELQQAEQRIEAAGGEKMVANASICAAVVEQIGRDSETALEAAMMATTQLKTCQGEVKNLSKTLAGVSSIRPPCWVDADGNIEYAFNVILTNGGLTIEDTRPAYRRDSVEANISFGRLLSRSEFLHQTRPYFDYGVDRDPECRFYVRQIDRTGSDKNTFNRLRRTVEGHFYKLER